MTTLRPAQTVELAIEKAAAGGRMIARHEGQVVLVGGALPGERVVARLERVDRRLAFAATVDILERSPDRRDGLDDPLCGGCVYSHISYARQLVLKADIIRDSFLRIGRIPLDSSIDIVPSPEHGYRMRARFHVDRGRVGFYREGTHALCDARPTKQVTDAALDAVEEMASALERDGVHPTSIELTENIPGDRRALLAWDEEGRRASAGDTAVADSLETLSGGRVAGAELLRHPDSFFQANRFLVPALVNAVLDVVQEGEKRILDLYAGVGLFALSLAAAGIGHVTAVEGDRSSGADLEANARLLGSAVTVARASVEDHLARRQPTPSAVVLDPPRTGISPDAIAGLVRLRAPRVVYVSCDPATMARDARRLLDAGYRLEALRGFDLFPNTAHVEALGVFTL